LFFGLTALALLRARVQCARFVSQLILFVALHLLGVVVCMAVGPWQRSWLCSALGFAVGLACMVFLSLGMLLLGAFHIATMAVLYAAVLSACIATAVKRRRWNRRNLQVAGGSALGFVALCLPFCYYNFSSFSFDSHMFVLYGRVLGADGHLTLDMLERLNAWGVFQVVAHALGAFVRNDYLYALAPAFAVSMFATFAVALGEALAELGVPRRYRALWMGLSVAVLLAIPLLRFHVVYIHSNMPSSGYLLCFVALFWLAEVKQDTSYLPVALLALLAFTLLRVEAAPYAILFLILTVMGTRLPRRAILPWYLLYTTVVVGWFLLLAFNVPEDSVYLTPKKCLLFAVALALVFGYWLVKDRSLLRHVTRFLPHLTVAAVGAGILLAAVTHGDNMDISASIWLGEMWESAYWALIWKCAALLCVVGIFVPAPPFRAPLLLGIWLFFGLTLIVAAMGSVFGPDIDGSLTRMTIHIVPIVFFYGALKFAPLLSTTLKR
jgi:hypothetical protein